MTGTEFLYKNVDTMPGQIYETYMKMKNRHEQKRVRTVLDKTSKWIKPISTNAQQQMNPKTFKIYWNILNNIQTNAKSIKTPPTSIAIY